MTITRVTVGSAAYSGLAGIQSAAARLAKYQSQLSSGNQITTPSDDPTGTVRAMRLRGALGRNDQYAANADDAIAWLSSADTAYSQSVSALQQARTLVVQGLNSGAGDSTSSTAIAQQLDGIRSTLLSLANTSYNGRPLFGGTTASGAAYDASGTYIGDNGTVSRQVGAGTSVQVNSTGPDVFGTGDDNVFNLLNTAATAVANNDTTTLNGTLAQLDAAVARVSTAQAGEGVAYQQVQAAQSVQTSSGTAMKTELSGIEDIDLADMAIKVTTANTTYQAALQTTASISQLSLLDFLR